MDFAEKNVEENLDYLETEWGKNSAIDCLNQIESSLIAIQKNPKTFLTATPEKVFTNLSSINI